MNDVKQMTDLQKLQKLLDGHKNVNEHISFEQIITEYIYIHEKDFNIIRMNCLVYNLFNQFLNPKTYDVYNNIYNAKEYATYVSIYLKGEMYTTKEAALAHLPKQIENAEKVVKYLKGN